MPPDTGDAVVTLPSDGLGVATIVGCTVVEMMEGMSDGTSDGESEVRFNDGPGVSVGTAEPRVGTKLGKSDVSSTIVKGNEVGMVDG